MKNLVCGCKNKAFFLSFVKSSKVVASEATGYLCAPFSAENYTKNAEDYLLSSPIYRDLTPIELDEDPAMFVILTDEATLGQILALPVPYNVIPPPGGGGPQPNTEAVKLWFRGLVATHCRTVATDLEPALTANPPLAGNVLLFHQLKPDEAQAILSFLGLQTRWAAELLRRGLSAGHLVTSVSGGSGRRGSVMAQRGVPPFIAM